MYAEGGGKPQAANDPMPFSTTYYGLSALAVSSESLAAGWWPRPA